MCNKKNISILILISISVLLQQTAVFSFQKNTPAANADSSDLITDKSDFDFINLINEGNLYLENKLYDEAIKNFKMANKFKETSNADKGLGLALFAKAEELDQQMATPVRAFRKKKYFEQSVEYFLKALKLEPNNINIRYHLANVFVYRNHPETLKLAETLLNQVIGTDIRYKNALILLSIVYKNLDQPDKAKKALEEYLKIKKENSRALYYLSLIAIEDDNYETAEKYYMSSLDNLKDEQAFEEIMQDLTLVFSEKDKNGYENAEHKGKFLKKFWLTKDPVPETKINERLIEHFRRVKYAKQHYTTQSLHGKYDARGETYIKYGHPDGHFVNGGSLNVYSNESWTYYWRIGDYRDGL
ncbi:GWxTD domain-containing protein, partial [bacterium]|nr:GWxTD domain-containing protein [bacterium]